MTTTVSPTLYNSIRRYGPFNATACMNCGTCTGLCPMGITLLPRELFRYVLLGAEDKVFDNVDTIFSCLLCKMCEDNCPGEVHIVGNVRTLRNFINKTLYNL